MEQELIVCQFGVFLVQQEKEKMMERKEDRK